MRQPCVLETLVLAVLWAAAAAGAWSHVPRAELDTTVASSEMMLVAFVTSSEEDLRSKHLEEEWPHSDPDIPLLSIDCTVEDSRCDEFGVESLPSIRLLSRSGDPKVYLGPRRREAILHYLQRQKRPVVLELGEETSLSAFKTVDDVVFIAYLRPEDAAPREAFAQLAAQHRDEFSFGLVSNPDLLSTLNVQAPFIECHRPEDEVVETFSSFEGGTSALSSWIIQVSRPYIAELTPHNHQRFLDRGWSMVYVFAATAAERSELRATLRKFAKGYYDSLTSVVVDPLDFPDLPAKLGLDPDRLPSGGVHQLSKDRVYPYPYGKGLTSNDLQKWGLDVWQGRIKPWLPPGVTKTYDDLGPTRVARRNVKINIPGFGKHVKIAGHDHDEL